jgi:hypothetical protein
MLNNEIISKLNDIVRAQNGNITVVVPPSLDVSNGSTILGNIGNVSISGGSNGQVLVTDGNAHLSWGNITLITNGNSNVAIPSSGGNVVISVNDTANVAVFHKDGLKLNGNLETTSRVYPESVEFANIANLVVLGGANGQFMTTDGNGVIGWTTVDLANANVAHANTANTAYSVALSNVIGAGNIASINLNGNTSTYLNGNGAWANINTSKISNGNSNVTVALNGAVTVSSNGQSNIVQITSNGSHAQTTIQNDVTVTGNLAVQGTTVTINTETQTISDPIVDFGVGANSHPLIIDDGEDRGLALHTFGRASQYTTADVTHSGSNVVQLTSLIDIQLYDQVGHVDIPRGTYVDALYPGNTSIGLSAATTKSISNGSLIEIGLDAIHFIGWDSSDNRFVIASNTSIGNNQVTYNQYGNIRMGNITVDRIALANSVPTANINSVLISDSTGNIVWDTLDRGIY